VKEPTAGYSERIVANAEVSPLCSSQEQPQILPLRFAQRQDDSVLG